MSHSDIPGSTPPTRIEVLTPANCRRMSFSRLARLLVVSATIAAVVLGWIALQWDVIKLPFARNRAQYREMARMAERISIKLINLVKEERYADAHNLANASAFFAMEMECAAGYRTAESLRRTRTRPTIMSVDQLLRDVDRMRLNPNEYSYALTLTQYEITLSVALSDKDLERLKGIHSELNYWLPLRNRLGRDDYE